MNGYLKYILTALTILAMIVGAALTFANKVDKTELVSCMTKTEQKMADQKGELRQEIRESEKRTIDLIRTNQQDIKAVQTEISKNLRLILERLPVK